MFSDIKLQMFVTKITFSVGKFHAFAIKQLIIVILVGKNLCEGY